jgi:hypothetical protein
VSDRRPDPAEVLTTYKRELLRWNRQMNLVSRRETTRRVDDLVRQCSAACAALLEHERSQGRDIAAGSLLYCDLGAGGGLPGFVWHGILSGQATQVQTLLVEPREKRAWFLERVARLYGPKTYHVLRGRWGEFVVPELAPVQTVLVSLKALRLSDPDVLQGLASLGATNAPPPERAVIARFYPEDVAWSTELARDLAFAAPGEVAGRWQGCRTSALPVAAGDHTPLRLIVSTYDRDNS